MKLKTILILVTIVFSVFSPFTAHLPLSPMEQGKCFISMDVCSASGSFLPANSDAPTLPEASCGLLPVGFDEFMETGRSSFASTSFPSKIEQPPRISS
jgi:hypothetical protein